jgi:hypothetical protein
LMKSLLCYLPFRPLVYNLLVFIPELNIVKQALGLAIMFILM